MLLFQNDYFKDFCELFRAFLEKGFLLALTTMFIEGIRGYQSSLAGTVLVTLTTLRIGSENPGTLASL